MPYGLKYLICLLFIFQINYLDVVCQTEEDDLAFIERIIVGLFDENIEFGFYEQIYEDLVNLAEYPVNINSADKQELERLFFLNDNQIIEIIDYRNKYGLFVSPAELLTISGFPENFLKELFRFIRLEDEGIIYSRFRRNLLKKPVNEILIRTNRILETKTGYHSGNYNGNPWKYYLRYRYKNNNKINIGLTAENDPGEEFFKGSNKYGFDFYSGFVELKLKGMVKSIVIGDFLCQFGQGTTLWNGFSSGKNSSSVVNLNKRSTGIKTYSSSTEYNFFRGVGVNLNMRRVYINAFISYKKDDASIEITTDSLNNDIEVIKLLYKSGFHRTEKEINNRRNASIFTGGANIKYYGELFSLGFSYAFQSFDKMLMKDEAPYNINHFNGAKSLFASGVNYQAILKKYTLFGELSLAKGGGTAILNGLIINPFSGLNYLLLLRWYSPKYQTDFSGSVSEGNATSNERGLYLGLEYCPLKKLKISGYVDIFEFPWLRYLSDAPSSGIDYLIRVQNSFAENFTLLSQYKSEIKSKNSANLLPGLNTINSSHKSSFRNQLNINISYRTLSFVLSNRFEFSYYKILEEGLERGWLFYQNIKMSSDNIPLSFSVRYAIFSTDSYNTRIYTYENDVLYSFSIPSFYGRGSRFYICIKYIASRRMELWFKYNITYYSDKDMIGSGMEEIAGNKKNEIKFQLRLRM